MTVRLSGCHMGPGQIATRARPVFDDDGLAERLFEIVGNLSGKGVRCTAGTNATTRRTGREGYACAQDGRDVAASAVPVAT